MSRVFAFVIFFVVVLLFANPILCRCIFVLAFILAQGGRTWQPFVGSKNGNEVFLQARIYNFRVKCVVFARNRKFAKLTQ